MEKYGIQVMSLQVALRAKPGCTRMGTCACTEVLNHGLRMHRSAELCHVRAQTRCCGIQTLQVADVPPPQITSVTRTSTL